MTKAERLFSLLTEVEDAFVEDAAQPVFPVPKRDFHWKRWAALAACLLLVFFLPRLVPRMGSSTGEADGAPMAPGAMPSASSPAGNAQPSYELPAESASPGDAPPEVSEPLAGDPGEVPSSDVGSGATALPTLVFTGQFAEGTGGSEIWTEDVSSYISNELPPVMVGDTLPVYGSSLPRDEYGAPAPTVSAKEALLTDILSRFGLTPGECTITSFGFLTAVTPNGAEILIRHNLVASVFLPMDDLSGTIRSADESSFESLRNLGHAVTRELNWLLNMESPTVCVTGGEVDLYGDTMFHLTIHDGDPTDPTTLIARVGVLEDMLVIDLDSRAGQDLAGEYPVITLDEAKDLLLSGHWPGYNEKWHTIPTAEQVLRSELVYCTDTGGLTMPYYRFYLDLGKTVELWAEDQSHPTGETVPLITLCYIPAVDADYLDISYQSPTFNS